MKNVLFYLLLLTIVFNSFSQDRNIPPEQPKLVVGIIISEMRYDYINRYRDNFSENGFKKLIATGTSFKNAHHDYLIAESGAGYATLATGAYPEVHGIVSNYWFERLKNRVKYCINDDRVNTIGGSYESGRYSPSDMLAITVSDQLKVSNGFRSKVISISLDPVASVFSGGHSANAAYWYDDTNGKWISSSFYCDSLPDWLNDFNEKDIAGTYLSRKWETLLPEEKYTSGNNNNKLPDKGFPGKNTFPYNLEQISIPKRKQRDYSILKYTPFGNTYTKDLAVSAIINEELGQNENTDWLTVSFSASSYIGRNFISWSMEMEDTYLRLDQDIAHFISFLDEHIGLKNILIYLTAENAIANEPTYMKEHRLPSGYFNYNSALSLLRTYLNVIYGSGDWIKFYYSQQIFLNNDLIEDSRISPEEFQNRVARFMVQFEGVSSVLTSENLMKNNYTHGIFEKMQKNYNQKRSGDILLGLSPGWVERGTDRDAASAFRYDSHVPLIFYGWKTGRQVVSRNISVTGIAPTLSLLLNISRPVSSQGEVIPELEY